MSSLKDRQQHIIGEALYTPVTTNPETIAAATRRAHTLRGQAFRAAGAALVRFLVPSWASTARRRHVTVDPYRFPDALTLQR